MIQSIDLCDPFKTHGITSTFCSSLPILISPQKHIDFQLIYYPKQLFNHIYKQYILHHQYNLAISIITDRGTFYKPLQIHIPPALSLLFHSLSHNSKLLQINRTILLLISTSILSLILLVSPLLLKYHFIEYNPLQVKKINVSQFKKK